MAYKFKNKNLILIESVKTNFIIMKIIKTKKKKELSNHLTKHAVN